MKIEITRKFQIQFWVAVAVVCFLIGFLSQVLFVTRSPHPHETLPSGLRARVETTVSDPLGPDSNSIQTDIIIPGSGVNDISNVQPLQSPCNSSMSTVDNFNQLMLQSTNDSVVPPIVRAWRNAKLDWHLLLPEHLSSWERFGKPPQGQGLRLLVSKEIQATDFLTRFHESGLAARYGRDHGPLLAYSGCDSFKSPCMIFSKDTCELDDLCMWSSSQSLCVDRDENRPGAPSESCTPMSMNPRSGTLRPVSDRSQCKFYVNQPAILLTIDSESQAMFYHWWASWSEVVAHWSTVLGSSRHVHYFLRHINDPMFFTFFGLLSDSCWRRATSTFVQVPPGACFCNAHSQSVTQGRRNPGAAADQLVKYLGLEDVKPPAHKAKVGLISRRRKRFILNEYELVQKVESMGFEVVLLPLETMTLYEQMREMRSLDVMIGIHGSGLDNSVFLHPGSVLVQLLPYEMYHRCTFPGSAAAANVKYQEWMLKDITKTVLHWDLFEQANKEKLASLGKQGILSRGQQNADERETLMFWINQDIIVPLDQWEGVVAKAVASSNAVSRAIPVMVIQK